MITINNHQILGLYLNVPAQKLLIYRKSDRTWLQDPIFDLDRAFGSIVASPGCPQ